MMKPYLITFNTAATTCGYAVVNARNPAEARKILTTLGRFRENKYYIEAIEELFSPCTSFSIVNEGSTPAGLNAYELAVQYGYKGTILEWLKDITGQNGKPSSSELDPVQISLLAIYNLFKLDPKLPILLITNENKIEILTTDIAEENNKLPITSHGVYVIVGKIDELLHKI